MDILGLCITYKHTQITLEKMQMSTTSSESHPHLPSIADLIQAACTAQT